MGVPENIRQDVINTLRHEIMVKYKGHINTGFVAARFFFEVLMENDMADVAYTVINQTDFPSFGHWIAQGATVTWEQWNGKDSHNHPMFGGGLVWFYRYLAGVQIDERQPGYKHFFIRPVLIDGLKEVSYSVQSPYGKVSSTICNNSQEATIDLIVPVGSTATVTLPVTHEQKTVSQGHYHFQVRK
jgi:alpha-L-rhamnosidase